MNILSRLLLHIIFLALLILGIPRFLTIIYSKPKIFHSDTAPSHKIAIVFGAGLRGDGTPTAVLKDRVFTAADLYLSGKTKKILLSGANDNRNYNEPKAMMDYALSLGIEVNDIIIDNAGFRTYDTCYRAKHVFNVDEALLVTQKYHLPRALLTCNNLGVKAVGVIADKRQYSKSSLNFWKIREIPATLVAFIDIWIKKPIPAIGIHDIHSNDIVI